MLDPENIAIAVGIALLSSPGAKIYAIQWYWPPSWIFHFLFLPLQVYSVDTCPIGMTDPDYIGIAVGIALLSSMGAKIYAFQWHRPPSWIFRFRFLPFSL